eukprot:CAMPEP_0194118258 /NCGR_PEP_ID=MMETSP0150-20130528/34644_1 /TAXON_ID=122233 /ORGANISM="Chaetoceros debilis, Strain MM31A-1" /LENGTH=787 /DNA_ID=CAMNT_0038809567 /DNA_START=292 /DNA_END=2655 /DNA_ORIENTATION=+
MSRPWLPGTKLDDDIFAVDEKSQELEQKSIQYLASLMNHYMAASKDVSRIDDLDDYDGDGDGDDGNNGEGRLEQSSDQTLAMELAHDRFRDLTCSHEGELLLEKIFDTRNAPSLEVNDPDVIRGAVIALQSFLMLGMQIGVKGTPDQQKRSVDHLRSNKQYTKSGHHISSNLDRLWESYDARRLKHKSDIVAGMQLLAELKRKRNAQSAFDILVFMGAWTKHEDVALLRSGFPTRFTAEEELAAMSAANDPRDPDTILGLRKDLRHLKAYTIDSESTDEIDDGLSIETLKKSDGTERKRIWVHIADADRWATRSSDIFQSAQERATSVYVPQGSVPMFPASLSAGPMSLAADRDSCALSLGLELNDDGSIDESTLIITPSIVNINFRLAYDEVDEMLECGVGYFEEWELGALLAEANKRRKYRISCGSTEGFVPKPIPQSEINVVRNGDGDVDILLNVEVSHNAGLNQSEAVMDADLSLDDEFAPPVSSAYLLVTEMMIMSGEAMGKLKGVLESAVQNIWKDSELPILDNKLDLPYRTQPRPDFGKRYQEFQTLESLKSNGYVHAWYARRFFESVRVLEEPQPHHGLGLDCYVQWSSPIRRFSDLQVHASVKRFLRRNKVNRLMEAGKAIPAAITPSDLGCEVPQPIDSSTSESGLYTEYQIDLASNKFHGINYKKGLGFVNAARMVQRKSNEYWLFEYVRRQLEKSPSEISYETTVLACVNPQRDQYAIFVHELGLEHRYISEKGQLKIGEKIFLKVASVSPRLGMLTFTLSSKYGGKSTKFAPAA